MNVKTSRYCIVTIIIIIICLTSLFVINNNVEATEEVTNTSLKVICQTEDVILSGMEWSLYRVGSNVGNNDYSLEDDFKDYSVSLKNLSTSEMLDVANTLENYAILDAIPPLNNGTTNEDGTVIFADLESGLYLLSGKSVIIDDKKYIPSAILVEVEENSEVAFQLTSYPKFTVNTISNTVIEYTVKKIWLNDDDDLENRPSDIVVELYQNGELAQTVSLNDDNEWSYSWKSLDSDQWYVKEVEIPKNYMVIYRTDEVVYLIVNTHEDGGDFTDTNSNTSMGSNNSDSDFNTTTASVSDSSNSDEASSKVTTDSTDNSKSSNTSNNTTTNNDIDKLPQTGQLWWPVPILTVSGLVLIAVGMQLKSKK